MAHRDGLRLAKVIRSHPEAQAVDLVFMDDGSTVPMVQVLTLFGGTDHGFTDLPLPAAPTAGNSLAETKTRDIYACAAFAGGLPVVVGFLLPQVCQILFADANRRIDRHASDVYSTIDGSGNIEHYHPSGTYVRIGTSPDHEDLTAQDFDSKWAITKNTSAAVHLHVELKNGGVSKAVIDIDPSGNIAISTQGTAGLTSTGDMTFTAPNIHFDTAHITASGDMTVTHDVTANGVSLDTHVHGEVATGSDETGPPS